MERMKPFYKLLSHIRKLYVYSVNLNSAHKVIFTHVNLMMDICQHCNNLRCLKESKTNNWGGGDFIAVNDSSVSLLWVNLRSMKQIIYLFDIFHHQSFITS